MSEWHAAGVNPPTQRRSVNPMNLPILRLALAILGAAFILCIGGIIWLSAAEPARAIPDVLVAVTTGILGLFGGILIPSKTGA